MKLNVLFKVYNTQNYITLQNKKNCTKKTELNQRNSYDTFVEKYTSQLT